MNAVELYLKDGLPSGFWTCGCGCRRVWSSQPDADQCCRCIYCREAIPPESVGRGNYSSYHSKCWEEKHAEHQVKQLADAEIIADYDGPVFWEKAPFSGTYGDGFFENVSELLDLWEERDTDVTVELPDFVFACESTAFILDLDNAIESATEEMYEDAAETARRPINPARRRRIPTSTSRSPTVNRSPRVSPCSRGCS